MIELMLGIVLPYTAAFMLLLGTVGRLVLWMGSTLPFPISTGPAPGNRLGECARAMAGLLLFPRLFRSDRLLWCGVWSLHVGLLMVLVGHLRYFLYPVPRIVVLAGDAAFWAGWVVASALIWMLARRGFVDRLAYLTTWSDIVGPTLLLGVCGSGLFLASVGHVDRVEVKAFSLGLVFFRPESIPSDDLFRLHILLGCLWACWFSWGRLAHALGSFGRSS